MVTRAGHAGRGQRQRALQRERATRARGADLIIPFVHEKLAPETRAGNNKGMWLHQAEGSHLTLKLSLWLGEHVTTSRGVACARGAA